MLNALSTKLIVCRFNYNNLKPYKQINIFNPLHKDKESLSLVFFNKDIIYMNINCFKECILGILINY